MPDYGHFLQNGSWYGPSQTTPTFEGNFAGGIVSAVEVAGTFCPGIVAYVHKQPGFGLVER
jgi:hypothetical protein